MSLELVESAMGSTTVLEVKGFIDTSTASILEQGIKKLLEEKKTKVVINLKDVEFVSSAGWGVLVAYLRKIRGGGGEMILACMIEKVEKVFELMEFDSLIDAYPTVEEAITNMA